MSVITISRETGSGGRTIAEQVASILGYRLIDKTIIGEVYSKYVSLEFGLNIGYVPDFWNEFAKRTDDRRERMVSALNDVIQAFAHHDNMVILGRSSFAVLKDYADVLNVRIQASLPVRIQRVMERRHISSAEQAKTLILQSDHMRAAFIDQFYGSRWDCSMCFNLVLDTGKMNEGFATNWIVHAVAAMPHHARPGEPTVHSIQVVPSLAPLIAEALDGRLLHT